MSSAKINTDCRVAVTSRSFSKHKILRLELLQEYAYVTFNDEGVSLKGDALIQFLSGHDRAIIALERIDEATLARLPQLSVISKYGVGLDNIDIEAVRRAGKRLGWTGGVNRLSVAELTLGFMIALLHGVPEAYDLVKSGGWRQIQGRQLTGRIVGIIGCGFVGKEIVRLLKPFRCQILAYDIVRYDDFYHNNDVEAVDLNTLLATSDVVTMHVPSDPSTRNMMAAEQFALMQPNAVFINAARGGILDEAALLRALKDRKIAGAALDVFANEPPTDDELLSAPNLILTSHIGGSTVEAVLAMGRAAIRGLADEG